MLKQEWINSNNHRYTEQYRVATKKYQALQLAQKAGLHHDEHGGYSKGDYHTLTIIDIVFKASQLRANFAVGKLLALVRDERKRVYAKSYRFGPGYRSDVFLLGTNESGTPFLHPVPNYITSVATAISWIWNNETITARHGDVAIAIAKRIIKQGETVTSHQIIDRHVVTGEIYQNGSLYARNAVLTHTAGQHPDITIGNEWHKIIIGRRSVRRSGTKD
jgi:hypothetical protein